MAKTIKANRRVVEDYQTLFVNRRAYTMQSVVRPHPESGGHHYFRPNKKGSDIRMMLTDDTIRQHLEGEITVGLYAINPSTQRCKSVAIDADYKNSLKHLLKLQYHLTQDGVQPALEVSKRVGHLWVFLATSLLAMECRIYIHDLASWLGVPVKGSGLADGIEVFPKHDAIGPGDSGNPIRGPLGMHRGAGRGFWFYGADYTLEAQIEYLNGLRKVTEEELRRFMTGKELKVLIPKRFRAAVQAITKAVNCTGSPHNHFVRVRQEEEGPRQSGQLQVSEARKTRQQPMWLERERGPYAEQTEELRSGDVPVRFPVRDYWRRPAPGAWWRVPRSCHRNTTGDLRVPKRIPSGYLTRQRPTRYREGGSVCQQDNQ